MIEIFVFLVTPLLFLTGVLQWFVSEDIAEKALAGEAIPLKAIRRRAKTSAALDENICLSTIHCHFCALCRKTVESVVRAVKDLGPCFAVAAAPQSLEMP